MGLIGLNAELMKDYISFVADHLVTSLGFSKVYGVPNPLEYMELISLQGKTNFFERRVGEYAKAGVMAGIDKGGSTKNHSFTVEEDF